MLETKPFGLPEKNTLAYLVRAFMMKKERLGQVVKTSWIFKQLLPCK